MYVAVLPCLDDIADNWNRSRIISRGLSVYSSAFEYAIIGASLFIFHLEDDTRRFLLEIIPISPVSE